MNKHYLVNSVWYDGSMAWVAKFIVSGEDEKQWKKDILNQHYDGELLKIDRLYPLSFDDIIGFMNSDSVEHANIIERYKNMYF